MEKYIQFDGHIFRVEAVESSRYLYVVIEYVYVPWRDLHPLHEMFRMFVEERSF